MIKRNRDIVVGQFYRAEGADGYYYVGVRLGNTKRLVCINLENREINTACPNPLFPSARSMYEDWRFEPCDQDEAMNAK